MTAATTYYSDYEPLAWFYNEVWGEELSKQALPLVEQLLLPRLAKGDRILDLCCGSGQLAQKLLEKGYQVTGFDASESMLYHARQNAPGAQFIQGDARFFHLPPTFHGVVSTTYALNYIMSIDELISTFRNVYEALLDKGLFVFDLSLEERFLSSSWHGSMMGDVQDEYAWAERRIYDGEKKVGFVKTTLFKLVEGVWQRSDNTTAMKCYSKAEVQSALEKAGFTDVRVGDSGDLGGAIAGKAYFVACK